MKKENKQPVIHQHDDYFAAKAAAGEWFRTKHNHECGTVMDEKRETAEGLYISFRSQQDPGLRDRYHVIINQNVRAICAVKKVSEVSQQQMPL